MLEQENNPFENHPVNMELINIPGVENLAFIPVEPQYWFVLLIRFSIFVLFLLSGLALLYFLNDDAFKPYFIPLLAGVLLFSLTVILLLRMSFKKRAYQIRNHDVVFRNGLLSTTVTILPINRIQQVKIHESVIMRFFKLAEIQIYTAAGQASGQVRIAGLKIAKAHEIRTYLISKINDRKEFE